MRGCYKVGLYGKSVRTIEAWSSFEGLLEAAAHLPFIYALTRHRAGEAYPTIIYIGLSTTGVGRPESHFKGEHYNKLLARHISRARSLGEPLGWVVIEHTLSKDVVCDREVWWIAEIGRKHLCNATDGGEGVLGLTGESAIKRSDGARRGLAAGREALRRKYGDDVLTRFAENARNIAQQRYGLHGLSMRGHEKRHKEILSIVGCTAEEYSARFDKGKSRNSRLFMDAAEAKRLFHKRSTVTIKPLVSKNPKKPGSKTYAVFEEMMPGGRVCDLWPKIEKQKGIGSNVRSEFSWAMQHQFIEIVH